MRNFCVYINVHVQLPLHICRSFLEQLRIRQLVVFGVSLPYKTRTHEHGEMVSIGKCPIYPIVVCVIFTRY